MRLREHTSLSRSGKHYWPPPWLKLSGAGADTLTDDSAVVSSITLSRIDPPTTCYLLVESGRTSYMGMLGCDDPAFCRQLYAIVKQHVGKTVKEIAEVDLP
jgi:hypothetical protein